MIPNQVSRMLRVTRINIDINSRMSMRAPPDLRPPTDDVGEDIRGRPRIVCIVDEAMDFIIGGIVDAKTELDKLGANIGAQSIWGPVGMFGDFVAELVSEVFGRVSRVEKLVGIPAVDWIGIMEFWVCKLLPNQDVCIETHVELWPGRRSRGHWYPRVHPPHHLCPGIPGRWRKLYRRPVLRVPER